ncbi:hypothetical protein RRG08_038930 [Elysia crispata]|uniref:Uncharacterized protein n=1 Tax=Elysia crispata TaxID=231223 RepID=A0AAE0Y791_9GAST|nr:hypothetical protein RRG08_038930 [Elysia crispata]
MERAKALDVKVCFVEQLIKVSLFYTLSKRSRRGHEGYEHILQGYKIIIVIGLAYQEQPIKNKYAASKMHGNASVSEVENLRFIAGTDTCIRASTNQVERFEGLDTTLVFIPDGQYREEQGEELHEALLYAQFMHGF